MDPPLSPSIISHLLGLPLSSPLISGWLNSLVSTPSDTPSGPLRPQVKAYPDVQYHLYFSLGIDLIFVPGQSGTEWVLDRVDIYNPSSSSTLMSTTTRRRAVPVYTPPKLPLIIRPVNPPPPVNPVSESSTPSPIQHTNTDNLSAKGLFEINQGTTGRDFVSALGEPGRKGGGTASPGLSLGVGPWLEWSNLRILVPKSSDTSFSVNHKEGVEKEWEQVGIGSMVELRESLNGVTEENMRKGLGGVWDRAAGWEWSCIKLFRVGSNV